MVLAVAATAGAAGHFQLQLFQFAFFVFQLRHDLACFGDQLGLARP